ncbi:MAG TPA: hypothetical protein VGK27_05010 [Candidatus Deferrimicrobiaceae bacterium]
MTSEQWSVLGNVWHENGQSQRALAGKNAMLHLSDGAWPKSNRGSPARPV